MVLPPIVTGLSPNEGPPGTRVTIRGENFGQRPTDLIGLTICGHDCLLSAEWKAPSKIIAISGPGKGFGDIIVTTKLGGKGTCNVHFKGYYEHIGPMKESAVWVEEKPFHTFRHSLSASSIQIDDPLGLSDESNEKKIPEDDLNDKFPGSSGDLTSENFSPCRFLYENHHKTNFNDLQAGLLHLRRKVDGQKEGRLSFLKTNISAVLDQIDTLMVLKDKFEKDVKEYSPEPTLKFEKAIRESQREAGKLYTDLYTRGERVESTRNALNVLTRFKFLFSLPCSINRNVKKGDYDIIINDYMRVKNLFLKRDIPIFQTVLHLIEDKITEIKEKLHQKLVTMPITVEEQKKLIRYLVNLDSNFEPAWDAILFRSKYLVNRMEECYKEHKAIIADDMRKSKSPHAAKYSKYNASQDANACPQNIFYVEELSSLLSELFPDIWKLGQAYFIGELHVKVEPGHKTAFKHTVLNIMEAYCKRLRAALIPHTLDKTSDKTNYGTWSIPDIDTMAIYLPECLKYVRSAYSILFKLDLPSEALDIVLTFILDLRIHCMSIVFKKTIENVKEYDKQETWKVEISESHCGITELPLKFEQAIQQLIQSISEPVFEAEAREGLLVDNISARKEYEKQLDNLLTAFYNVLTNLVLKSPENDEDDDENQTAIVSQLIGTPTTVVYKSRGKSNIPIRERRLLMTLANCQYTSNVVLTNIVRLFTKSNYQIPHQMIKKTEENFKSLETSILENYLEQKSDPLVGTIEPSMYLGRFDWHTNFTPVDIRPYAKECINNLIHVHFEVNSVSSKLVDSILPQVVQTIAEELYRLMSCVQKFSLAGAQQALIDIGALQEFFEAYSTERAKNFFKEAIKLIPALNEQQSEIIKEVLKESRKKMRLQILCLQKS
ncbi:exocyst complex component 2 [Onthophagus taurus]|uniref:exocyst complex component 2 n=1 Tax=Onthophagus taurus TaxID=166361 RepID=UPI0039BECEA6